jgi:GMP synthase (glutamine-hydrolysing)
MIELLNMKKREDLKILLLQIREDASVRKEEHESFAFFSGLEPDQITIHNVFDQPEFSHQILEGFDALFIGGASEASVLDEKTYSFLSHGNNLIKYAVEKSVPTFASCFGFQMAVIAFGGTIIKDCENFEMGTCSIDISEEASNDPLFREMKKSFWAVSVHQEKALELPSNCQLIGFNEHCCQAFRVKEKPFWAFQFHPELDRKTLKQRLNVYKDKYTEDIDHYQEVIYGLVETPDSNKLLSYFINNVLLSGRTSS